MDKFYEALSEYDLPCVEKMYDYWRMVEEKNKYLNLTRITEISEVANKHFLDSLSLLKLADLSKGKILDIGTGAGFPGVPIAICTGNADVTLLDSSEKKMKFVRNACSELDIDVTVITGRAEELGEAHRASYDYVVSRAVAELRILLELAVPLLKLGGVFFAYKRKSESELSAAKNAIKKLGVQFAGEFATGIEDHVILCFKKTVETDKKYPRKYSQIKSKPL